MRLIGVVVALCCVPSLARAQGDERPRLLVLDFQATEGVEEALINITHDRFIATLKAVDRYDLATSDDLRMMLQTEKERQLLSCADDSCLAEIAGAMGARYLSRGRLSLLDDDVVLTLQLFDSQTVSLDNQVTSELPRATNRLGARVEGMTYSLLRIEPEGKKWYERTWLWVGVGVVVAGTVTAVVLASGGEDAAPNLGRFTFDG